MKKPSDFFNLCWFRLLRFGYTTVFTQTESNNVCALSSFVVVGCSTIFSKFLIAMFIEFAACLGNGSIDNSAHMHRLSNDKRRIAQHFSVFLELLSQMTLFCSHLFQSWLVSC